MRRFIPESPRWLILHARLDEAETVIAEIERRVARAADGELPEPRGGRIRLAASSHTPMVRMVLAIVRDYPQRAVLGLVLMGSQAFFYNAIFFSYALVLTQVLRRAGGLDRLVHTAVRARQFLWPAAARATVRPHRAQADDRLDLRDLGRAAGDRRVSVPRRQCSTPRQLTLCWTGIFFFASAAASAAYLTVSESFPLEARALAIAFFYAVGTALGGVVSPWLFGTLVGSGERGAVFDGYLFGAGLMIAAALTELAIGVKAERQPLESVARPLSALAD